MCVLLERNIHSKLKKDVNVLFSVQLFLAFSFQTGHKMVSVTYITYSEKEAQLGDVLISG